MKELDYFKEEYVLDNTFEQTNAESDVNEIENFEIPDIAEQGDLDSFSEIDLELLSKRIRATHRVPSSGGGPNHFNTPIFNDSDPVVFIRVAWFFNRLRGITIRTRSGIVTSGGVFPLRSGNGWSVNHLSGRIIYIEASGKSLSGLGWRVTGIRVQNNRGRLIAHGSQDGERFFIPFNSLKSNLLGIFGTSGADVDQLGVYFSDIILTPQD